MPVWLLKGHRPACKQVRVKDGRHTDTPAETLFVRRDVALEVLRKVLKLLLLVLPRRFLILLHLQLPALLVQALQLLNLFVGVSYRSRSRNNRSKTGRSILHTS